MTILHYTRLYTLKSKSHIFLFMSFLLLKLKINVFFVSGTKNEVNILLQDYHVYKGRDKWSPRCSSEGVENSDLYDV